MHQTQFDDPGLLIDRLVLPAAGSETWVPKRAASVVIPFYRTCEMNGSLLDPLMPTRLPDSPARLTNQGSSVGLAAILSLHQGDALFVFGSRVHGTETPQSDLDLMVVTDRVPGHSYSYGKIAIVFETPEALITKAREGDLFQRYLTLGATAVIDPNGRLDALRAAFRLRETYAKTLAGTADIVHMLLQPEIAALSPPLTAGKLLWAVRTFLMAEGADPFLSQEALDPGDLTTLRLVHSARYSQNGDAAQESMRQFLIRRGRAARLPAETTLSEYADYFETEANPLGLRICQDLTGTQSRS